MRNQIVQSIESNQINILNDNIFFFFYEYSELDALNFELLTADSNDDDDDNGR